MYSVKNIIDTLGYDSFYKGRSYSPNFIKHINTYISDSKFIHEYKVKSQATVVWYDVKIINNGYQIYDFSCECIQFKKNHTCKHVAAVFIDDMDHIFDSEFIDETLVSKSILKLFNENKAHSLKQKLNFEFEFNIDRYITFMIYVGDKKKYILSSETKFNNFFNAYLNNEEYSFGKYLIYNPDNYYIDEQDKKILEYISGYQKHSSFSLASPFVLSNREFKSLISMFENKNFIINKFGEICSVKDGLPTKYELLKKEGKYILEIEDYSNYKIVDKNFKYVVYNNTFCFLNNDESNYLKVLSNNKINHLVFDKEDLNDFSSGLFNKIKKNIVIDESIDEISMPIKPEINLYFDFFNDGLFCDIKFDYNGKIINYFDNSSILRDEETEKSVLNELMNYGFNCENDKLFISDLDVMYFFIEEILPNLSNNYNVFTSKKIDETKILKKLNTTNNFSIGKDNIMSYSFDVEGIDLSEIKDIFKSLNLKKKYYKLKNNNVIDLENNEQLVKLNELMIDLDLSSKDLEKKEIVLPKYRALFIDSLKKNNSLNITTNNIFDNFIDNFNKYKDIDINLNSDDDAILREYQKIGVKWLKTIYKCGFGGILADEMGLGKSIQAIMFIKEILREKPDCKIIIVAPTSLIYNWKKEFEKFGSEIKHVVVAENKKKRKEVFSKKDNYNVFITTYGLIRNDNDEYENMDFELCIIDEAQAIKNYQAGMTREVKKIKANCKIALTGTPVENNITELWSIFDFIMPGYLSSAAKFRQKYNIKDVNENEIKIIKKLSNQITPFILRRKKKDVAKSLPDKIENKIYIDLPKKQKMLYLKILNETKDEMNEIISRDGFNKSRVKILQLLTKLRQICIDPYVLYDNYSGESIKIDELIRIVREYVDNGHKILIFSSFKRILDRVKVILKNNSISSYMIDGSVKSSDRVKMVEAFNKDNTNCFLITLKAGGTGLNLVGADVVIHLDIWWNPQVENQATDRAHRIGQTKKVNVVKLITTGTIEEKIIELQEKKKKLSENLIEENTSENAIATLSDEDIKQLLSINK